MVDLIKDAIQLIKDKPQESAFINEILKWDDEMKAAFKLAWRMIHEDLK